MSEHPPRAPIHKNRIDKGLKYVLLNLVINVILAVIKITSGFLGHSYALVADGIESLLDIFSSTIVWGGLKIGSLPPDRNHPFGHGRAETLSAMIVSAVLIFAAVGIAFHSVNEIVAPHLSPKAFTIAILIVVVVIKEVMFRLLSNAGESIESLLVKTDAWHSRSDALTSLAAFIGISIALIGGKGYESADDWAALFASGVIFFNGYKLLKSSIDEIMDSAVPGELENKIRQIGRSCPGVADIEKCRVRKSGLDFFVEIHIVVDENMPVKEGHRIGHEVKQLLLDANLHILDVITHIEPGP